MWTKAAKLSDLQEGAGMTAEVNGQKIALFNVEGRVYAVDNTCPHRGGPLGEGYLDGTVVTCPWHAWQFDVATGECQSAPGVAQKKFAAKIEGGDILVDV